MRVLVTRPQAQADALVAELRRAGIDAVALPLIDIAAVADPQPLVRCWQGLPALALVMFVSANAVQHFMQARPPGVAWPDTLLAGSTGPGTSAALRAAGVPDALLAEPQGEVFDSEALWARLSGRDWQGRRVRVVRGEDGRDWLAEQLAAAGAQVDFVAAYRRVRPAPGPAWLALRDAALARPAEHLWVVSSSEAVAHLQQLSPGADWSASRAVAPHPRIVAALQRLGFGEVHLGAVAADALVAALAGGRPIQSRPQ